MLARYNADLANTLGNLVSRVTTLIGKKCGGHSPNPTADSPLRAAAETAFVDAEAGWAATQPSRALEAAMKLVRETNEHLTQTEPWKLEAGPEVDAVLGDALEAIRIAAVLLAPALVNATERIWGQLGLEGSPTDAPTASLLEWGSAASGRPITAGSPVFPRLAK
jgi:methionyl-tRNA synthetase